jgi:acetylornithine/succinyldiaminopimelate/putrescine aminotransferase/predicted amino acid dehydrogenase
MTGPKADRWAPLLVHSPAAVAYEHYARPLAARLLAASCLDAVYERAEGDHLWVRRGGELVRTLDLVGGYGANLLGHHHPEIVAEARRLLDDRPPVLAQGSIRAAAAKLAETLCRRLGDYVVIFTNSGAETIEAAIKHLHLERQRPVLWAVKGAFHGKTTGAMQLTWSQREQYAGLGPDVRFLDPDDPADWDRARAEAARTDSVGGLFVEPIQGEGGIRPLPPPFVDWVRRTTALLGIPIVVDEIQTGFGRTGTFLAADAIDLQPDYLCLSKALGGGLSKIGALLIRRERFQEEFSVSHTSTFAEDDWSSALALKALEIVERDRLPDRCAALGTWLLEDLRSLQARFPGVIKEVRGRGLMVGVELCEQSHSCSTVLRTISRDETLGWLASAYLFNAHDIRIAPTVSQPFTLRIEPSAYVAEADLTRFVGALETMCRAIAAADAGHLVGFMVGRPLDPIQPFTALPVKDESPQTPKRVAFLVYLNSPEHAGEFDPSLARFSPAEMARIVERTSLTSGPSTSDRVHVRSRTGETVHLTMVGLNATSQELARLKAEDDLEWITDQIDAAVAFARDEGCQVIGLGGYTSSVTASCLRVRAKGIALTSGNALAVGMGVRALKEAARRRGISIADAWLGVVGVPGNIATTVATIMGPQVGGMVLVARTLVSPRIPALLSQLKRSAPETPIEVSDDVGLLRKCSLVLTATVGAGELVHPSHLGGGPVVVCDMSVPSDVSESMSADRPDVLVIPGGIVRLTQNEQLTFAGVELLPGHTYACMAETLLMGLEGTTSHGSYGSITPEAVDRIMALADKHGFVLADVESSTLRSFHALQGQGSW